MDNNILCPRCSHDGFVNPACAIPKDSPWTAFTVSCDKHGTFEFIGDISKLSLDAAKKDNLEGLKRHARLSFNLGLLAAVEGYIKVTKFIDHLQNKE